MAAIKAQGTTFTFADALNAPQTVGGIQTFNGFDGEAADIDITTLASLAKEYDVGLEDFGNFTFDGIYDSADVGQAEIESAKSLSATRECVLTLSNSTTLTFNAIPKSFSKAGGIDGVVNASVSLRITGAVTIA